MVWVGVSPQPWEGAELAQAAHQTFDGRVKAVTSRQHSVWAWFALRERHGKDTGGGGGRLRGSWTPTTPGR